MADTSIVRSHVGPVPPSKAADASAVGSASGAIGDFFPELLTPKECAAYRRCSVRKLDRERAERRGSPYVRIDGRIFYRRADVDRFIESHLRLAERASSTSEESAA
jgi:hypothetical protein